MEDRIDLWDIFPHERWCTRQDLDVLISLMLSPETVLPRSVIVVNYYPAIVNGEEHFAEGAVLEVITTTQRTRNPRRLKDKSMTRHLFTYSRFMRTYYWFVETRLKELPFKRYGQMDMSEFTPSIVSKLFDLLMGRG